MNLQTEPVTSQERMHDVARRAIRNPMSSRETVKAALMMLATSDEPGDALLRDKARVILWPEYQDDLASDVQRRVNRMNKAVARCNTVLDLGLACVVGYVAALVTFAVIL